MTDYAKIEVKATYSEKSSYDPALAEVEFLPTEYTPGMHTFMAKVKADDGLGAPGTGTVIDLAHWSTVDRVIIKNLSTVKCCVNFTVANDADFSSSPAPAAQSMILHAGSAAGKGGILILSDLAPASDLEIVALATDAQCQVWITGTLP